MTEASLVRRIVKPAVFAAALIPFALLVVGGLRGDLGVNPVETVTHRTGFTALTMLMCTLAVTPVQRLVRVGALVTLRRPLGLFAFFYALLHFLTYAVDQTYLSGLGVSPAAIMEDVRERPYITVGFTAFVLLVPLALTSTRGWIKRLGGKRWRRLHRLVYVAAGLAVLHFLWLVKADLLQPVVFAGVLGVLLAARLVLRTRRPRTTKGEGRAPASEPVRTAAAKFPS
jgi:sulfoxide reductase heme-binding subunit YedZ